MVNLVIKIAFLHPKIRRYYKFIVFVGIINFILLQEKAIRNTEKRWSEHNHSTKNSEPARHLKSNCEHSFGWKILCNASKNKSIRKKLEALFIGWLKTSLNNKQENFECKWYHSDVITCYTLFIPLLVYKTFLLKCYHCNVKIFIT